jgi:DNA-binding MarR family transcriptional regulator
MAGKVKLTGPQHRVLMHLAAGQSVHRGDCRLAYKLEARGLIENGKATAAFGQLFTYYDLTPAGRALLASGKDD